MPSLELNFEISKKLWGYLGSRRRLQLLLISLLVVVTSISEVLSIGAVMPFLGMITSPGAMSKYIDANATVLGLVIHRQKDQMMAFTAAFCIAVVVAGGMRVLLLWSTARWAAAAGTELGYDAFRRTLYQPYSVHVARNSSEVIAGVTNSVGTLVYGLSQVVNLVGALIILLSILIALLFLNPSVACASILSFGIVYCAVMLVVKGGLRRNGQVIARESVALNKCLQESMGGIREIIMDGSADIYCRQYRLMDFNLRRAQGGNLFLGASPRYAVESLSMLLIALVAYNLSGSGSGSGLTEHLPLFGAFVLGAQRMLPAIQTVYLAWATLRGGQESIRNAISLLDQKIPASAMASRTNGISFQNIITMEGVSFKYEGNSPWILRKIDLTVKKGDRLGIVGGTGSGKSTLLDILVGLLPPTEGVIKVDGKLLDAESLNGYQACIAQVPQSVFLIDGSIEENIAFGVDSALVNSERIRLAADQASLSADIERMPDGYRTVVGERGVRLSGGQKQRIGIARALYKRAQILVFDEATSALDSDIEADVMRAINSLGGDLTIIIIAHRVSTLAGCNQIIEVGCGGIKHLQSYDSRSRKS